MGASESSEEAVLTAPRSGCGELVFKRGAGCVGLSNLGNTCFMNAGLQCLSHLEPLAAFFLTGKYQEELNGENALGTGGELAKAFARLQGHIWQGEDRVYSPSDFHKRLAKYAPHLCAGYRQQDVQEFLAFCLDGLHEDLNRVAKRPPPLTEAQEEEDERLAARQGEEFAAALAWYRYLERGKSFLVDLLQGQLRSTVKCCGCGFVSRRFDPFLYLSLPVSSGMSKLDDCISAFLEEELLSGSEQWHCAKCCRNVDATKKMELWQLPPILVLHLKRFEFNAKTQRFGKISTPLAAPLEVDFGAYLGSAQRESTQYDVVGVINHRGSYNGGHYTAACRVGDSQRNSWHHFDDERVTSLGRGAGIVGPDAYVLFLARCSVLESGGSAGRGAASRGDGSKHHSGYGAQRTGGSGLGHGPRPDSVSALRRQTVTMPELWPHYVSTRNSVVAELIETSGRSTK
eukprot:TRINITY_DN45170_c0_g1_i1.p1 TRINITY_DN45170_c0_g1~~TRINITY_DN45170_c0_g1_i1.p1  ORF type:complete len:458 (-),score=88.25 TRINITY_DN45170_c0_g1_i1:59-1432(-)